MSVEDARIVLQAILEPNQHDLDAAMDVASALFEGRPGKRKGKWAHRIEPQPDMHVSAPCRVTLTLPLD